MLVNDVRFGCMFFIFLFFLTAFANATPTTVEAQITQYVSKHREDQLSLLEKLVNTSSGTTDPRGVHQVGELLRPQFEKLGFQVHWEEEPPQMHRAGSLIAEHPGKRGKRLLLIGHLDTVSSKTHHLFKQQGDFASGSGIIDDKGGILVILYALEALDAAQALANANITVILTGDEEDSGKPTSISRKPLLKAAKSADIALDFEPAMTLNTVTTARRGISQWTLSTQGHEAHSSAIFQKNAGAGAVYELVRILDAMRIQFSHEKYLTANPGLILGGTSLTHDHDKSQGLAFGNENVVAKMALAEGDLRFISREQKTWAEKKIVSLVSAHLPGTNASIRFEDGIPAMSPKAANLELLKKYSQASIHLGYGAVHPLDPGLRGAGDISHVADHVSACLAGLGPMGSGAHSDQEMLDLRTLPIQTQRAALFLLWLSGGQ